MQSRTPDQQRQAVITPGQKTAYRAQTQAYRDFGWVGETTADSVFYYRIHSPVLLVEFDH